MNSMFSEDIAEREKVDDKKEGPQDRALGHTTVDRGRLGLVVL